MMGLNAVQDGSKTDQAGQGLTGGAANAAAAKEQFLSLLVAQISHQNPMKPMDDKDLITQLAQFSSVEQAIETNSRLGALQQSQSAASRVNMAALVGKEGIAQTDTLHIDKTTDATALSFTLESMADSVTIRIIDRDGNVAHTVNAGTYGSGAHSLAWDGQLQSGQRLPEGDYKVQINAADKFGNKVPVSQEIRGRITGVDLSSAEPFANINGAKIRISDVTQLNG